MIATALSIAGSDPSGGAGIQADLKTFSACGVYGMSVITALTAQNTTGVSDIHFVPPEFVSAQISAIFDDIRINSVKIGMIANAEIGQIVADSLQNLRGTPIVLDPVMIAKGGHSLLAEDAVSMLKQQLLPLADMLTPNLPEAASLLDESPAQTREAIEEQGRSLLEMGPKAVLMKGGHLEGPGSPDLLVTKTKTTWLETERIKTKNTHGTGCTLSAAIAAEMARGESIETAVRKAKTYILGAIASADNLKIGTGHGPTHHFHQLWN